MSGETTITLIGHLVADPDLHVTQSGKSVTNFTIASNPRQFKNGEWVDGDPLFMRCQLWGHDAEHATDSLRQGQRVIAQGYLKQRKYEKDGVERTIIECVVGEIGPSLKFGTTKFTKTTSSKTSDDPWSSTSDRGSGGRGKSKATDYDDEPPF